MGSPCFILFQGGLLYSRMHLIKSSVFSYTHSQYLHLTLSMEFHMEIEGRHDPEDGSCQA